MSGCFPNFSRHPGTQVPWSQGDSWGPCPVGLCSGDGFTEQEIENIHDMAIPGATSSYMGAQDFFSLTCLCFLFSPQTCITCYECGDREMNFWSTGKWMWVQITLRYKIQYVRGKVQCVIKNEKAFPLWFSSVHFTVSFMSGEHPHGWMRGDEYIRIRMTREGLQSDRGSHVPDRVNLFFDICSCLSWVCHLILQRLLLFSHSELCLTLSYP